MTGPIQKGECVIVTMSRRDVFPWQVTSRFRAIYESGPCGPGDTIGLTLDETAAAGTRLELNGNAGDFIGLYRGQEEETP